ncbi:centrosomal protein of 76 kDa [Lingula anatina]|uniref:Centrosomal protein of 76 kDa n=1 Tax=Lingula anatina TaxID=7574 RepID=A0A1S3HPS9_LINAN|nr:centrosomal protein of 76 kDa [Lingula anatina]|eukprot:XP_013388058.1 centrosomal protein of 76 kDa [Lingula anatina]
MSLPPEKIGELKQIIHNHLSQHDIQSRIKDVLSQNFGHQETVYDPDQIGENEILDALRRQGVVDDIMQQLAFDGTSRQSPLRPAARLVTKDENVKGGASKKTPVDPTRRYIYFQILGGKAFLEHLHEGQPVQGHASATFTLHLNFRGQRFSSRPVACACEPDLKEGFLLELHKDNAGDAARMADPTAMLSMCDPLHLVLIKTDSSGDRTLLSSQFLEWRTVLASQAGRVSMSIELMGVGTENKVPVGILDVQIELIPKTQHILADVISAQLSLEKSKQAEKERLFLVYAKQWWREFLQIRQSHGQRMVKIFAQDENCVNKPVCSFVRPLRAGRLLDTPREASRFVSLIGYEKVPVLGGGERAEQWANMHTFLCRNKGDSEDHAVLLCSLLMGFGLDSYVCVGTKSKGAAHAWVVTINTDGLVTFWESLTGHRYIHRPSNPDDLPGTSPKVQHPYKTVGAVFNHQSFYANSQPNDSVQTCHFDLQNEARWKSMSEDAILSLCGAGAMPSWPGLPPLCASTLDPGMVSNSLELELRALVTEHRREQGLNTSWDDQMSYLLTPALAAYETERLTGVPAGNEDFQDAVRRAVPDGHTFKGYPVQFIHRNAKRAFAACLRSPVCEDIIQCRGDHVRLAVRVRVFPYPESACATWLMFACKYKSVL